MACGCNTNPFNSPWACPDQADPWHTAPENPLKVVVLDTRTNEIRALRPDETPPNFPCGCGSSFNAGCGTQINIGQLPTSKVMQDAYFELATRLRALEQKYCECICTPGEGGPAEPDSWQSPVVEPDPEGA